MLHYHQESGEDQTRTILYLLATAIYITNITYSVDHDDADGLLRRWLSYGLQR